MGIFLAKSNYKFLFFIFYTFYRYYRWQNSPDIWYSYSSKQDIDEAKEYKEFYETCDFEVAKKGYKFTGSFIDALGYIRVNFKGKIDE